MKEWMISLISISISISKISMFLTSTYYTNNKSVASNDDFGLFKMCIRSSVLDVFSQACLRCIIYISVSQSSATCPAVRYREDCAANVLVFSK